MRPAWIGSRRLTHRSSVLLPLPLGPITTSTSPVCTSRSMPSRTRLSPKLFRTPSSRRIGPRCRLGVSVSAACAVLTGIPRSMDAPGRRLSSSDERFKAAPGRKSSAGHLVSVGRQVYSPPARRQATRSKGEIVEPKGGESNEAGTHRVRRGGGVCGNGRRHAGAARRRRDHVHRLHGRVRATTREPQEHPGHDQPVPARRSS